MMYPYLRFWAYFLFTSALLASVPASLSAQNADSLLHVLNAHVQEDSSKVRLYNGVAAAYRFTAPDSVLVMANRGLALAEKLHFDQGIAQCYITKTLSCLLNGNLDEGAVYSQKAIKILDKTHDSEAMGQAFFYLGAIYYNQSKFEKAIEYYVLTVRADRNTKNYDRTGDALDNIGVTYSSMGKYSESLKYYLKAMTVREKENNKDAISTSLGNIGRVYASLGNRKKAIEYINRSLAMQEGTSPESVMINYENAGNVYLNINDTVNALKAFENAIKVADSSRQYTEINRIMVNASEACILMKQYDKAYAYYMRCLANTKYPNGPAVDAMIHRGLGRIYAHRKQYREAIKEIEAAITMFRENEMNDHLSETLRELANIYGETHDYTNGYRVMKLYNMYRDSVLNEETENKVKELQYNYDLQKKQTEIELLAKDKAIAQSRAEKQNAISVGLVSGLVLLVIIIAVMYRSRQKEVAAKNMITEQAARLGELNNYKDKIFSVLAHDLRGPIGALSSAVTMLDEKMISPKEFSELNPLVRRQLTSVTLLLDNLLKWSMSHMAMEQPLKKEKTALLKLVSQNISLVQYDIDMKGIVIENNVTENTTATGNAGNIDIIIRNLISNAVKFTNHGGKIIINAVLSDDKVSLSVIDNGVGIDDEQLKQLFAAMTGNSTVGTKGERGVGLGLLMSKEFAKANDGDITVCSKPGKGSTFTLILPS